MRKIRRKIRNLLISQGYATRPKFLVVGAQKGGTSAIFKYLNNHPNIKAATEKEINFFDQDITFARGTAWYHHHFPLPHELPSSTICFEASPSYMYYPHAAPRIKNYDPNMKLIVLVRNPIERAFSQWNMYRLLISKRPDIFYELSREANEPVRIWVDSMLAQKKISPFIEELQSELELIRSSSPSPEPSYLRRGLYLEQIQELLKYFDRKQILIIDSNELKKNTADTLISVTNFLDIPVFEWKDQSFNLVHARKYKMRMPKEARNILTEFFILPNEAFFQFIGKDLHWT